MAVANDAVAAIRDFLREPTPEAWLECAAGRLDDLLIDHANCELKAASSALAIIYRYPERDELVWQMSRLAREELRHFEQVRQMLTERGIPFRKLSASRYASALHDSVRRQEPLRLLDTLIVGALIEARSCERFGALIPHLPDDIGRFYQGLLASESRHFRHYLAFAKAACDITPSVFEQRIDELLEVENRVILSPDEVFRFHSGLPAAA